MEPLPPRIRSDLRFTLREDTGEYIVRDEQLERYHSVGALEVEVFKLFDGKTSLEQIARIISERHGGELPVEEVAGLARNAAELGLLQLATDPTIELKRGAAAGATLLRKLKKSRRLPDPEALPVEARAQYARALNLIRRGALQDAAVTLERLPSTDPRVRVVLLELQRAATLTHRAPLDFLQYQIPLVSGADLCRRLDRYLGWMFSPLVVWTVIFTFLWSLSWVVFNWVDLQVEILDLMAHPFRTIATALLVTMVSRTTYIAHELGHGVSCAHFGGRAGNLGILITGLSWGAYCDVSDAYTFSNRWHRMAVALGGPYVDLMITTVTIAICAWTQPGTWIHTFFLIWAARQVVSLIYAVMPFYKDDAYFVISEWAGSSNLLDKALSLVKSTAAKVVLGVNVPPAEIAPGERKVVVWYGLANVLATALLLIQSIWLSFWFLTTQFRSTGLILFAFVFTLTVGRLFHPLFRWLWTQRRALLTSPRSLAHLAGTFAFIAGLSLIPVRPQGIASCRIVTETTDLVAPVEATVRKVQVRAGDRINAGDVVAQLDSPALDASLKQCRSREHQARLSMSMLRSPRAEDVERAKVTLAGATRRADSSRSEVRRLEHLARRGLLEPHELLAARFVKEAFTAKVRVASLHLQQTAAGGTKEELAQAEMILESLSAQCDSIDSQRKSLMVRAPVAGTVMGFATTKPPLPGERVEAGAKLVRLQARAAPRAEVEVSSADVALWLGANDVQVRLLGASGQALSGRMEQRAVRVKENRFTLQAPLTGADFQLPEAASCRARAAASLEPFFASALRSIRSVIRMDFWSLW